jgi:hypothetical protein
MIRLTWEWSQVVTGDSIELAGEGLGGLVGLEGELAADVVIL